jgi:hypothetical protein
MKPKEKPIIDNKHLYRNEIKELVKFVFSNNLYDPNDEKVISRTNIKIFDILENNLDEIINWSSIGVLYNKATNNVSRICLFDNRAYYVITSSWQIQPDEMNATEEGLKTVNLGPSFWRIEGNSLTFELPVSYPFNGTVLINSLNLFDGMEYAVINYIQKLMKN